MLLRFQYRSHGIVRNSRSVGLSKLPIIYYVIIRDVTWTIVDFACTTMWKLLCCFSAHSTLYVQTVNSNLIVESLNFYYRNDQTSMFFDKAQECLDFTSGLL